MAAERKQFVYVLQLEDGYFYVGKSEQPARRINQHFASVGKEPPFPETPAGVNDEPRGAAWTKRHPPVRVSELREISRGNLGKYEEDNLTKEMMYTWELIMCAAAVTLLMF